MPIKFVGKNLLDEIVKQERERPMEDRRIEPTAKMVFTRAGMTHPHNASEKLRDEGLNIHRGIVSALYSVLMDLGYTEVTMNDLFKWEEK